MATECEQVVMLNAFITSGGSSVPHLLPGKHPGRRPTQVFRVLIIMTVNKNEQSTRDYPSRWENGKSRNIHINHAGRIPN